MKFTVVLAVTCAAVALISCESCTDEHDCSHTSCDSTSHLGCSNGDCTCLTSATAGTCAQTTCSDRSQCDSCQCRDSHATHHCFDGLCFCGHGAFPAV